MKRTHIIGIIIIAIAIGAILSTVADSSTYASFSVASQHIGKEYHVVGKLNKQKGFTYNPVENVNLFVFYMIDNDGVEKKVLFNGSKPQDFERSEQIVLVGKIKDENFIASKILMKCPSKYKGDTQSLQEYNANS